MTINSQVMMKAIKGLLHDKSNISNNRHTVHYTPYEGPNLDNQSSRKLRGFDRKSGEVILYYTNIMINTKANASFKKPISSFSEIYIVSITI